MKLSPDELDQLRAELRAAVRSELRAARQPESRRILDPRKQVIASLLKQQPNIKTKDLCSEMDTLQEKYPALPKYKPVPNWKHRRWVDCYEQEKGRVQVYIAKIRRQLSIYLD